MLTALDLIFKTSQKHLTEKTNLQIRDPSCKSPAPAGMSLYGCCSPAVPGLKAQLVMQEHGDLSR